MNWTLALPEIVLACCGMAHPAVRRAAASSDSFYAVLACSRSAPSCSPPCWCVDRRRRARATTGCSSPILSARSSSCWCWPARALGVILSLDYNRARQDLRRFEFPVLMLFATVGMMVMASATNLMSLYLGLELQSLAIYVLAAFARDELRSVRSGAEVFRPRLAGLRAAAVRHFAGLRLRRHAWSSAGWRRRWPTRRSVSPGLIVGVVFVIAGLAFKISAVPFHMWTPDVYEGAPTPVTAFFAHRAEGGRHRAAAARHGHAVRPSAGAVAAGHHPGVHPVHAARLAGRHRPAQHQAADGLFLDRPHGLRADRPGRRHPGRACAAC